MSKNEYSKKISPITSEKIEAINGRGEEVLFWQGELLNEKWHNCAFYHCRFEDISLISNLMQGMSFFSCVFNNLSITNSCLSGISFNCSVLENVDFSGSDLSGLNFYQAKLVNCNFSNCEMDGINFDQAELINCNFSGVDMRGINLTNPREINNCGYNFKTKLSINKNEAYKLGLVYLSNHLTLVKESEDNTIINNVVNFPLKRPVKSEEEKLSQSKNVGNGTVIQMIDYKRSKPSNDEGPSIA